MLNNLIQDTQKKIAQFVDSDVVDVKVTGQLFEVKSGPFTMFSYDFKEGRVMEGQAHKVGFTPSRLWDLRRDLQAVC